MADSGQSWQREKELIRFGRITVIFVTLFFGPTKANKVIDQHKQSPVASGNYTNLHRIIERRGIATAAQREEESKSAGKSITVAQISFHLYSPTSRRSHFYMDYSKLFPIKIR